MFGLKGNNHPAYGNRHTHETKNNISKLLSNEIDISLKHQQDYIDEYEKSKAKPELTGNVTELKPKGK